MKRPSFRKRTWVIGLVVAVVAAIASMGAYAYWTTGGSGTGSAATGDVVNVTVNQLSAVSGLYPGGPAQALSGDFDNPNAGDVYINDIVVAVDPTWSATLAAHPNCTAADFQINNSPILYDDEIGPGNGVGAWSGASIQMLNSATDQDACKNVTVPLVYTVNAH
jgi:hypothetical protein